MDEIITRLLSLPGTIHGYTICDANGDFNIYLNSKMGMEKQIETYEHELKHIQSGDFSKPKAADLIEIFAHEKGG